TAQLAGPGRPRRRSHPRLHERLAGDSRGHASRPAGRTIVADSSNPYPVAPLRGRLVEERPDHDCCYMDPIAIRYTSARSPNRGPHRVCFVIAVETAWRRTLGFARKPSS